MARESDHGLLEVNQYIQVEGKSLRATSLTRGRTPDQKRDLKYDPQVLVVEVVPGVSQTDAGGKSIV